jgi:hypothetical protein
MESRTPYSIHLDVRYAPLELVDVQSLIDACDLPWYNQTFCRVNDCAVRLGALQGEFHWHKHDNEDEFFYVVEGRSLIDLEGPVGGAQAAAGTHRAQRCGAPHTGARADRSPDVRRRRRQADR